MQTPPLKLRPTERADLEALFGFQLDEQAAYLAAFMPADYADKAAYIAKYTRFLADPTIHMQTIVVGEAVAGSVAKFVLDGEAEITYWLGRPYWGRGLATAALRRFLALESSRPLLGRVAFDNVGSQRVLENCGFVRIGADTGFASARQAEIGEFIYQLH